MKYSTYKNPLYAWYKLKKWSAKKHNTPIFPDWENWHNFAKWCEDHDYDEHSKLVYHVYNPFSPEFIGIDKPVDPPFEYIAYEATDPYELIICSAPTAKELSEKLKLMGYDYATESIHSSFSRNEERGVEDRIRGLIFERIDLRNYNEDGEPFETKEND